MSRTDGQSGFWMEGFRGPRAVIRPRRNTRLGTDFSPTATHKLATVAILKYGLLRAVEEEEAQHLLEKMSIEGKFFLQCLFFYIFSYLTQFTCIAKLMILLSQIPLRHEEDQGTTFWPTMTTATASSSFRTPLSPAQKHSLISPLIGADNGQHEDGGRRSSGHRPIDPK